MSSDRTELAIKDTILGALCNKDLEGRGIIHSSDFRTVVSDLGFPFGSSVVESCLVHCRLDASGYIDFNDLKKELAKERSVLNDKVKDSKQVQVVTSTGTPVRPWRADLAHQEKINSERQYRAVQEHRAQVHQIYNMLSHHEIDANQAVFLLSEYNIYPTKDFTKVLNTMQMAEVGFADFMRTLMRHDKDTDLTAKAVSAGGHQAKSIDVPGGFKHQSKRHQGVQMNKIFFRNEDGDKPNPTLRPTRKLHQTRSMKTTQGVFDAFHTEDGNHVPLMSHLQEDMVHGTDAADVNINFNSEQRLQREQVFAMLRRLDSGAIAMSDFQDKMFSMGFDLPEGVQAGLRHAVQAGRVDVHRFAKQIDATVFKVNALEERCYRDQIGALKERFIASAKKSGYSSDGLLVMGQLFRKIDANGDGFLSFTEFKIGCQKFFYDALELSEDELRILFNSFDVNGDGVLEFEEFLGGISGSALIPRRGSVVQNAFTLLDREGVGYFTLDDAVEKFQAHAHPDVESGKKSEREVLKDFVTWFSCAKDFNGTIDLAGFKNYYCCISALVSDDHDFKDLVNKTWGLSDKKPPPPEYRSHSGPPLPPPMAKQTHGDVITWEQEASRLERVEVSHGAVKMKRAVNSQSERNNHTDVIRWSNHHGLGHKDAESAYADEFGLGGGFSISRRQENNYSSKSLLAWSQQQQPQQQRTPNSPSSSPAGTGTAAASESADIRSSSSSLACNPYEREYAVAGSPTKKKTQNDADAFTRRKPMQLANQQYHHGAPFDTDQNFSSSGGCSTSSDSRSRAIPNGSSSNSSSRNKQPKSLAETLKVKKSAVMSLSGALGQQKRQ